MRDPYYELHLECYMLPEIRIATHHFLFCKTLPYVPWLLLSR